MRWLHYLLFYFCMINVYGQDIETGDSYFPDSIPRYDVRHDRDGKEMTRGDLLKRLYGPETPSNPDLGNAKIRIPKRLTYSEFAKALQCPTNQPDFDDINGAVNTMKLVPPSKASMEWVCAFVETRCSNRELCQTKAEAFKAGNYPAVFGGNQFSMFEQSYLMRVKDNVIYWDWCWGKERLDVYKDAHNNGTQLQPVLNRKIRQNNYWIWHYTLRLLEVKDSVFLIGTEQPIMPFLVPFPSFNPAPKLTMGEMPIPWPETFLTELRLYKKAMEFHATNKQGLLNFTDEYFVKSTQQRPWKQRIPKAAFYASYNDLRRLVWDQAVLRPDLIDAPLHLQGVQWQKLSAWNPTSRESAVINGAEIHLRRNARMQPSQPGYIGFLANITRDDPCTFNVGDDPFKSTTNGGNRPCKSPYKYIPGHYKYVVVVGIINKDNGHSDSTSGRLAHLLAHSGAVILLQSTTFRYHFSARLIPWVHYVPLSYSSGDLIEKIEWLQKHDHLAQQIADNGRNFGKSYLRMEDYFCYVGAALQLVGRLEQGTNVI